MQAIVLGSAAGGGVPQWNCRCPICTLAWDGDPRVKPRTQSSLAISADRERWLVVNASPDIRQQIAATPQLQPKALRHSPIAAVLLTNGDVDHVAGLLSLREGQRFTLYATADIQRSLADNRVFGVVSAEHVPRENIRLGQSFEPLPGLLATLFAVPGKVALWLEGKDLSIGEEAETTVGVLFEADGKRIAYVPGCAEISSTLRHHLRGVDLLLFDGTVLEDDDLIRAGVGIKTGRRMGHVPMRGEAGSLRKLADLDIGRRVFVHINNTNPVLVDGSDEQREAEAAGWTVAYDGLSITL